MELSKVSCCFLCPLPRHWQSGARKLGRRPKVAQGPKWQKLCNVPAGPSFIKLCSDFDGNPINWGADGNIKIIENVGHRAEQPSDWYPGRTQASPSRSGPAFGVTFLNMLFSCQIFGRRCLGVPALNILERSMAPHPITTSIPNQCR